MAIRVDITVATVYALADVYVSEYHNGANAWVVAENNYFTLIKSSGATPDANTIQPTPGSPRAGLDNARWIRNTTSPVVNLVLAGTLAARPAASAVLNGATYDAQDQKTLWYCSQTAVGVYTWDLINYAAGAPWLTQITWFIDPANVSGLANDANSGATALLPLLTVAEFFRRLPLTTVYANVDQTTTVNLMSAVTEDLQFSFGLIDPRLSEIVFVGTKTTIFSGTMTTVVNYNDATQQDGEVTDSALPVSWTASGAIDKRIIIVGGARDGAYAFIMKDLGAKTARYSPFYNPATGAVINPVVGDAYTVQSLSTIRSFVLVAGGSVGFSDLQFITGASPSGSSQGITSTESTNLFINGCDLINNRCNAAEGGQIIFGGTRLGVNIRSNAGSLISFKGTYLSARSSVISTGGILDFTGNCVGQGQTPINLVDSGIAFVRTWVAAFDTAIAFVAGPNCTISVSAGGRLWGTGITGTGISVSGTNSHVVYDTTTPPLFSTPTNFATLSGVAVTATQIPVSDLGLLSGITSVVNIGLAIGIMCARWAADASLVNAAAQFIPMYGAATSLTAVTGAMNPGPRSIGQIDVAFTGNAANVAGQTVTIKIQRSTDHGATFADVTGATSGALATTAGAKHAEIAFTAVTLADGDILQAVITPSAALTAVVTTVSVAVR